MAKKPDPAARIADNKKAAYNYFFEERFEAGLVLEAENDLTAGVVRALEVTEARKQDILTKLVLFPPLAREFAGMKGSMVERALRHGQIVYLARRYRRPA